MITLNVQNVWTTVKGHDDRASDIIDKALKCWIPGIERTWAYRSHKIDGYEHHYSTALGRFRSGLVDEVAALLRKNNYDVEIIDKRIRPAVDARKVKLRGIEVWQHQQEAIEACANATRGTVANATGSGKTDTFVGLTQMLGVRTLVLSNQKSIAVQTVKRFANRLGVPEKKIGLWGDGKHRDGDIVCATFQTVSRALRSENEDDVRKWLKTFDMIIVDEGHHLVAKTYQDVFDACPAFYRFAFSATPFKSKGRDKRARLHVIGSCGPVVHTFGAGAAVAAGIITPCRVVMFQWHGDNPDGSWDREDFAFDDDLYEWSGRKKGKRKPQKGLYAVAVVENKERNAAVVDACAVMLEDKRSTLVLVREATHGETILYDLSEDLNLTIGKDVDYAHGGTSQAERERMFKQLGDGKLPILICTTIADEGIDVPGIDALILAGAGKADHRVIQQLGRGQRRKKGKEYLQVIDFFDTHSKTMWLHAKARLAAYQSDPRAYEVEVVKP